MPESKNAEPHVTQAQAPQKFVYDFTEGNRNLKDLLGGKGANLAEMTNLGLPVPPGFTITTEACKTYLDSGDEPVELRDEVSAHLAALEKTMGKELGQPDNPLLVSVRSGAKFSMPGMMDTVLNIGLSDKSVAGLTRQSGDERFAWDSYRSTSSRCSARPCSTSMANSSKRPWRPRRRARRSVSTPTSKPPT